MERISFGLWMFRVKDPFQSKVDQYSILPLFKDTSDVASSYCIIAKTST